MITDSPVLLVKAIHNFKGTNNDELCLKKGDVITVTQAIDGGWWEGTLNGVTGWFPSNYVKELKTETLKSGKNNVHSSEVPLSPNLNEMKMYRGIVFQDIVDTENNHLSELQSLSDKYLKHLAEADILNSVEYSQLINNMEDVCACSRALLNMLEDVKGAAAKVQRIGGIFIQIAPLIKKIHLKYCSEHPKAVSVIEKHKDALEKFMEEHGANPPGILTLTTGLSRPFRRLEKYPALLQELQRHTQENHIDRGDTQRAVSVYRDIAAIHTLGSIVHMGPVIFLTEDSKKNDRYLVLFPETLVILSISPRMSAFVYEGKLPLSGISVRKLDSFENFQYAFEIIGNMIQRIVVVCSSAEILNQWLNSFRSNNVKSISPTSFSRPSTISCHSPSHTTPMRTSISPNSSVQGLQSVPPHPSRSISPDDKTTNPNRIAAAARQVSKKVWPNWNLRPHPPMRASLTTQSEVKLRRSNSCKKEKDHESEGDLPSRHMKEVLNNCDRTRNTVHSATASAPPRLNFEEDKIIIDDDDSQEVKERTLVDTVYMLKDQIQELKSEISSLRKTVNEDRLAMRKLEMLVKQHILQQQENHLVTSLEG